MKVFCFAASNSKASINRELINYVIKTLGTGFTIDSPLLTDFDLPIYGIDLENQIGIPEPAIRFANHFDSADFLIFSLAEHNGTYTAAFKNLLDWTSRIKGRKTFANKPVLLLATSTGPRGGQSVLAAAEQRFPFMGGNVVATFSLPSFQQNFADGQIVNPELNAQLNQLLKLHLKP